MSPIPKYKQWQKDQNFPVPKRTLARLKGKAAAPFSRSLEKNIPHNERTLQCEVTGPGCTIPFDNSMEGSDHREGFVHDESPSRTVITIHTGKDSLVTEEKFEAANSLECQNLGLTDPFHLKEDRDYRDSDFDEACQSTDSEDSDSDESYDNRYTRKLLYPGASITVEESILSVMKYAFGHKTSDCELSDLLHLIVRQIGARIVGFMVKAPNFAQRYRITH